VIATFATSPQLVSVTLVGETLNATGVGGGGAGTADKTFEAVTVTAAPLASTTAIWDPALQKPMAVTVNRPGLLVTRVGETWNEPGCEIE
jgi:hypothetical protein